VALTGGRRSPLVGAEEDVGRLAEGADLGFPSRAEELELHERVLAGDPLASVDAFKAFVEPVAAALRIGLPCPDDDLAYDAAVDAVYNYLDAPDTYDRDRARLSTFLKRIATRRLVDHLRSSSRRKGREEAFQEAVELSATAPNEVMERGIEARGLWKQVEVALPDAKDRDALKLILAGERATTRLADAFGVSSLPIEEQRLAVKRHRDRILKVLERIGEGIDDDEP